MRSLAILAIAVPAALACAPQPVRQPLVPPTGGELEVRLYPATAAAELQYFLSEPAYLTLFAIAPDGRARLVYPYYREKHAPSLAGLNALRPRGQGPQMFNASARPSFYLTADHPHYLYLIASKSPVELDAIERSLKIVPRTFSTADISESLGRLESLAVGGLSEDYWSSALLTVYPSASVIPSMVPPYSTRVRSRVPARQ